MHATHTHANWASHETQNNIDKIGDTDKGREREEKGLVEREGTRERLGGREDGRGGYNRTRKEC